MKKIIFSITFFIFLVLLVSLYIQKAEAAPAVGEMGYYCINPPFVSDTAPPLVMFIMSKDQQLYFKAYTDTFDLDNDSIPDTTYKDSITYYGYFSSDRCYDYVSGQFNPAGLVNGYVASPGISTDHYCMGAMAGKWSGNFLNWAAMSRIDVLRKVIYGGQRFSENNNDTVLGRAKIPSDAHAWAKVYTGTDINKLTPSNGTAAQSAITLCNANFAKTDAVGKMKTYWGDKSFGPASTSNTTGQYYPNSASVESVGGPQCVLQYNTGAALPAGTAYDLKVKVCDSTAPGGVESYCMQYASSWRPSGLLQKYGLNRHETTDATQWTNQMYFGLMTGSFDGNKSGGVLRSNITDVNSEIGSTDGKKNNSSKLIKTLEALEPVGYDYGTFNWTYGSKDCTKSFGFTDAFNPYTAPSSGNGWIAGGACPDWGNPIGEMFYEAYRYFKSAASPTPTAAFAKGDTGFSNLSNESTPNAWSNPWLTYPKCSKPFVLILSDIYPSFDSDQLPGSNWVGSFTETAPATGLNVRTLMTNAGINTYELINPGITSVFVGDNTSGVNTGECTAKATTDMGLIRGLCSEEPTKEGSFYIAGLAREALVTGFNDPAGNHHNLSTYVVATPTATPNIEFTFGANKVQLLPSLYDGTDASGTPTHSRGQLANFTILAAPGVACDTYDKDCVYENGTNGYQYGYEATYDNSGQGADYDMDIQFRIYVKTDTVLNKITVKTKGTYSASGTTDAAGYIINGVERGGVAASGDYLDIVCAGTFTDGRCFRYLNANTKAADAGYTQTYSPNPANKGLCRNSTTWVLSAIDCNGASCGAGNFCDFNGKSETVRTFDVTGSHSDFLENPLFYAAKYGGFTDSNGDGKPDITGEWDKDGDGMPNTYFYASNPLKLEDSLEKALNDILRRASSGTAASVLASGEGSGANLVQAIFFPKRPFWGDQEVLWTGNLQNLWYYIDPRTDNSTIRENTSDVGGSAYELNLNLDRILNFRFDTGDQKLKADLYDDATGDGVKDTVLPVLTVTADRLKYLWEAGVLLWNRTVTEGTADERKIYTPLNTAVALTNSSNRFSTSNVDTLRPYLNTDVAGNTLAQNQYRANNIIKFVEGIDPATCSTANCGGTTAETYRSRTVNIDLNNNGLLTDTVLVSGVSMNETLKVWKLGDIVNSTPRIVSWVPLNKYDKSYSDTTYTDFLNSNSYRDRGKVVSGTGYGTGMVFTGANDGMLHAFRLGTFEVVNDTTQIKAKLSGTNLGKEEWAFIPQSVLPYLKYLKDTSYCHVYSVDLTPFIFDASIDIDTAASGQPAACSNPAYANYWECKRSVNTWKTILIGGLRYGGACNSTSCTTGNCIQPPTAGKGISSYFALDITDPTTPKLLWEFSDANFSLAHDKGLGLTTSGPAVMRIKARKPNATSTASEADDDKNGRWFIVFGSGPTGNIDTNTHQFQGKSDQNLKLYVLDLKTGQHACPSGTAAGTPWCPAFELGDTGGPGSIANAFAGSLNNANIDYDNDYQDNVLYVGYTAKGTTANWADGGVLRLVTNEDLNALNLDNTALNPMKWKVTKVMEGIGPVTSSIGHLAHYPTSQTEPDKAYLFFGTGRYFFKTGTGVDDFTTAFPTYPLALDTTKRRRLFGILDPCLSKIISTNSTGNCVDTNTTCAGGDKVLMNSTVNCLGDATTDFINVTTYPQGWFINLDGTSGTTYDERVLTDPLALSTGQIFFTTFAPSTDICQYGGLSYLWALKYDTGGSVAASLRGKGLLQLSTGEVKEIDLGTALTEKADSIGGRRTVGMSGVPPTGQGLSVIVPPKPLDKILHIRKQ